MNPISIVVLCVIGLVLIWFLISYFIFLFVFKSPKLTEEQVENRTLVAKYTKNKEVLEDVYRYAHQLNFKEVSIDLNKKQKLKAYYLDNKSHTTFILLHGYKSSGFVDYSFLLKNFIQDRYNVLLIAQRSHTISDGKYISFGHYEQKDLIAWTKYLKEHHSAKNVFIYGTSMGSSTLSLASKDLDISYINGMICDCGYTSPKEIIQLELKKAHLSVFLFYPIINLYCQLFIGFSINDDSCVENLKQNKIPILFIHGDNDHLVPYDMGKKNYDACQSYKEFYTGKGSNHAKTYFMHKEEVNEVLEAFMKKCILEDKENETAKS